MTNFRKLASTLFVLAGLVPPAARAEVKVVNTTGAPSLQFTFHTTRGSAEISIDGFLFNGKPISPSTSLQTRQLSAGVSEITAEAPEAGEWQFAVQDQSDYYGFGERFNRLNHAHSVIRNVSRDSAGAKGALSYQPIPFFMSTSGYGLWVDTFGEATFDLNVTQRFAIEIKVPAKRLRFVLFEGPQFPTILDRYTALTGRQQLPPYWAFAPWKARDYHRDQADVNEDVDRYRALGLPASIILIDSPWATNYNTYEFSLKQFTDPRQMIAHLHDEGYKLILWHTSWINSKTARPGEKGFADKIPQAAASNYAEADRAGYFLHRPDGSTYVADWWKGTGSLIDFTNPAATKWWQDQVSKAIAMGADGFKDDDAEGNFIGDVKYSSGEVPQLIRNRYAVDYNHAVAGALAAHKGSDWVLFQRSGTTGSTNLPLFWSGDNDGTFSTENGLPTVVTAGLNAGMSGLSLWISDLGGYNKRARFAGDDILFERWTQYSAFSPGMEVMSQMNLGPWDYGDEALRIFRDYSVLHMSLFPYRYAAAQESARNGLPMMRALALMDQDDPEARDAETEYYFGPDLLVAPILSPVTQRAVYLPAGDWVDYWSGKTTAGSRTLTVDAPIDRLPLFVRAGAILPKIPDDIMTLVPQSEVHDSKVKSLDDRRVYEIYPGALRTITDFEGRTISPGSAANTLNIAGKPARITLRWRFSGPSRVTVDGRQLATVQAADGSVSVEFAHQSASAIAW
jgi:alpha-D-xyloside xylohydrolase